MIQDVIVVGSGPSGATAAYELAKHGLSVLILERKKLPRYKPCGGGIVPRITKLLDFDLSSVIEDTVHRLIVSGPGSQFELTFDRPLLYMVMRDRFDRFLTEQAVAKGAALLEGEPLVQLEQKAEFVEIETPRRTLRARFVIGADGTNSYVAKLTGLRQQRRLAVAAVSEFAPPSSKHLDDHRGAIRLDFGFRFGGYGWVFPKEDHLSPGLFIPRKKFRQLDSEFARYLARCRLASTTNGYRLIGHLVPLGGKLEPLHQGRVILVGDAAGLVDPFTAEGISWAIQSGQLAAKMIAELREGEIDLFPYTDLVHRTILPELRAAAAFSFFLDHLPALSCRCILPRPVIMRNFAKLLWGEVTYRGLWRKVLRKLTRGFLFRHA